MSEGIRWLDSLQGRGIRPGLDSITALSDALGNPEGSFKSIHVAGSDGKGSVCCMIESILVASGLRVGMFTSPHILKINESIRIDGKDIDDDTLDEMLVEVKEASSRNGILCTSFEALTACAFLTFSKLDVDIAIIEVGMGGRSDATNIIHPIVTVINNISLEHTSYLGATIEDIAKEKAGIMKTGISCITMNTGAALKVIKDVSEYVGCSLTMVDPNDIQITKQRIYCMEFRYKGETFSLSMSGSYQSRNAALAIEAVRALDDSSIAQHIGDGLQSARWPFRMEKLKDYPVILDVTHTRTGAEYLSKDIKAIYGKVVVVTGMLDDKDLDGVAKLLSEIALKVYVSSPDSPRAASAEKLAECYRRYHNDVTVMPTIGDAMEEALRNNGFTLVTGSFRTAEDCLKWLRRNRSWRFWTSFPKSTTKAHILVVIQKV